MGGHLGVAAGCVLCSGLAGPCCTVPRFVFAGGCLDCVCDQSCSKVLVGLGRAVETAKNTLTVWTHLLLPCNP